MNNQQERRHANMKEKDPNYFYEDPPKENNRKGGGKQKEDFLGSLTWALILIWAGLVFLASNLGWLEQIPFRQLEFGDITISGLSTWSVIFLGAGVLVLLEALIRTFVPSYRSSTGGNYFFAAILLGIGLGGIIGWQVVWPFILIGMGFAALASALLHNRG